MNILVICAELHKTDAGGDENLFTNYGQQKIQICADPQFQSDKTNTSLDDVVGRRWKDRDDGAVPAGPP